MSGFGKICVSRSMVHFCPRFLGGGGDLRMLFCHSVNAVCMVGTLRDGGDTQTLPVAIELFALTGSEDAKTSSSHRPLMALAPARTPRATS